MHECKRTISSEHIGHDKLGLADEMGVGVTFPFSATCVAKSSLCADKGVPFPCEPSEMELPDGVSSPGCVSCGLDREASVCVTAGESSRPLPSTRPPPSDRRGAIGPAVCVSAAESCA